MKGKEKLKRILSGLIGLTVVANTLLIMPLSTFAASSDEQTFVFDGYTIDYTVTDVYNNTEVVSLTMTNTGEDVIEDWMLYFNPHGEIQYVTDGELKSTSNGTKYIKNSGYNANIAPNESVSFSYAVNDCEEVPSNYIFCQKRVVKETGFDIDFQVNYDWDDSFNGDIIIQNNTDTPIEAWELTFDTNFTITEFTNSWAADVTELGSYCYMMKGTYTGIIGAYTSVPLGFMGKMNGEPEITDCVLTEIVVDEDAINGLNSDTDIDMTDTDSDGLPDFVERELGTNPEVADTDGDGLPDGFELLVVSSDPLNPHTFDSVLTDGEYDNDGDGLSNLEEFLLGTDVNNKDTDRDGLEDGAEVNQYGTDPLNPDTDGDGISDGDEITLNKGLDPRLPDSDGNGIPDGEEKFQQDLTYYEDEANVAISEVTVTFEGTGYIRSTTQIKPADNNVFVNSLAGLMGKPFSFETTSDFWGADISFKVECDVLGEDIDKLGIVWFDEQFQQFRLLDSRYDAENCIISAYVPHFSIYCVVNREEWVTRKGTVYFEAASDLSDTDNDMMPDCYEATNRENPENTFILSNGDETFSLVGEKDTDNDTIIDGAEVVFCTVGDANCDGTVDDKDVVLVQQYLQGKAELSKIGYVNADCNLDGKIDEDDITNIQNYLENGVQVFDFSEDRLQDIVVYMSSQSIGDVDGNGLREVADVVLLQKYILGSAPFDEGMYKRADLNNDNVVDVIDLALLKRYVLYNRLSLGGYSFFYCVSNPLLEDSDGDLDLDNADPNPMEYQLNGYFAEKMGELQLAAQEYLGDSYQYGATDLYSGKKDLWLSSYYVRQFITRYTSFTWNVVAGSDKKFVSYVNKNYPELNSYFANTKELYVNTSGQTLDCYHCYATLSSLMENKSSELYRNVSGWAGDLQTVINQAYSKTSEGKYENIGIALYDLMGNDSYNFGLKDLYGDIDSVNLEAIIRSSSNDIETIINEYYSLDEIERNKKFVENTRLTTQLIKKYISNSSYNHYVKVKLTTEEAQLCANAFRDYLQDTLGVEIS